MHLESGVDFQKYMGKYASDYQKYMGHDKPEAGPGSYDKYMKQYASDYQGHAGRLGEKVLDHHQERGSKCFGATGMVACRTIMSARDPQ